MKVRHGSGVRAQMGDVAGERQAGAEMESVTGGAEAGAETEGADG